MRITSYRYPHESLILVFTFLLVLAVIALTATATVCASGLFILAFLVISYNTSLAHHRSLLRAGRRVSPQAMPGLAQVFQRGVERLQPGQVEAYVVPEAQLNAYTFGLSSPKVVVLYSALFEVMDEDEILFILGHELGHVALGHTWLNSLVGGMAGIPSSFSAAALMSMAFLWWNRACEYSADRAGLLACGKIEKAVTALLKLAAGPYARDARDLEKIYRQVDAEDDTFLGSLNEALGTHPLLVRRIQELRQYARSDPYQRLKASLERSA